MAAHVYEDDEMAADCATLEALLSARPLALGGQKGAVEIAFLLDRLADFENDINERDWHGHVAPAVARVKEALSTTPARAEVQDEGAAGEPVAWRKFSTPVAQAAYDVFRREGWMPGDIDRFYVQGFHNISKPERGEGSKRAAVWWAGRDRAKSGLPSGIPDDRWAARPSPTPAADADRVRIAVEALEVKINAPLTGPTHGAWDRGRIAGLKEALAALKSEGK